MFTDLNEEQVSLLMYLEYCAVDNCGWVDKRDLEPHEIEQAESWNESGYLTYAGDRVALSDQAWQDVGKFNRERANRGLLTDVDVMEVA